MLIETVEQVHTKEAPSETIVLVLSVHDNPSSALCIKLSKVELVSSKDSFNPTFAKAFRPPV